MKELPSPASSRGLLYGLAAYGLWGVFPLYFHALKKVLPPELLAHRIVWSVPLLLILLAAARQFPEFRRCFRLGRLLLLLLASTVLIAVNWYTYIYAVVNERVVETSLGYFTGPLVSVLLGRLFLGERLRWLQIAAVVLAAAGVAYLVFQGSEIPWIALTLACSFSLYGFVRKLAGVDAIVGLSVETLLLVPLAAGYLVWLERSGPGLHFTRLGLQTDVLLLLSGIATAMPLLCFGQAAKLLPLTVLGFLQYSSPSIQFLLAVFVLGEPFNMTMLVSFCFIWTGLLIFSADSLRMYRQRAALQESLRQQALVVARQEREEVVEVTPMKG
jgi:chloramphenicol-sensitive protein RarD